MASDETLVSADLLRRQLAAIFGAWGMAEDHIQTTLDIMLWADLAGIDSHGAGMMQLYHRLREQEKLTFRPEIRVVRENPATALVDGGGGLGHVPSVRAMDLACDKAATIGVGVAAVRNSHHYGAAGAYAERASDRGLIGIAMTAVARPSVVPLYGADAMFGTNPIAFAAPAKRNPPFLLDMATSTAALGKITIASRVGKPIPDGWAVDPDGRSITDPDAALSHRRLTPLGSTRAMGGHKGYGLAMMVEVLCTTLSGAQFGALRERRDPDAARHDVGHFFLAIDPDAFREEGAFEADLDEMIDALRATRAADPAEPVQVAGDPEVRARAERQRNGIPLSARLAQELRDIATAAGAPILIGS
ncbi:malate dehydrogenase [Aliidongia dinghuensis]|uniref:Malate dehydrogenase n=1 Tax=Aliidongia dinghuensis TaxID=1867774 RepID=A0A8J2YWQ6_9PROT|nr:Ldh family oxidoreductase [Aliidongia dinghuensis]GGF25847.1 malate dehydrogenase [Aliidongia dinghuensis]